VLGMMKRTYIKTIVPLVGSDLKHSPFISSGLSQGYYRYSYIYNINDIMIAVQVHPLSFYIPLCNRDFLINDGQLYFIVNNLICSLILLLFYIDRNFPCLVIYSGRVYKKTKSNLLYCYVTWIMNNNVRKSKYYYARVLKVFNK